MVKRSLQERALRRALRVTANLAFLTFALPLAAGERLPANAAQGLWRTFLAVHAVHASLIARLALRHRGASAFSPVSIVGGTVGYASVAALTAAAIAPGPPPREPWRRHVQRTGHNILLGLHAFTIAHGYLAKGRDARAYAPLAAAWLAAARGMARTWDVRPGR
jgi:hypothetical protein